MDCNRVIYSRHAVERMFERGLAASDVRLVLQSGESIAQFPDDRPFPSTLILGFVENSPVHILNAFDASTGTCIIVTVYRPDPELWESDFRKRKRP